MTFRPKVLELYCGIGGCAAALGERAEVVAALDINPIALDVYRHNFDHPAEARNLDFVSAERLAAFNADIWWASPPCQPFTRRGRRLGLADPRAATLITLLRRLKTVKPRFFAMENVEGFQDSDAHELLLQTFHEGGYKHVREFLLCPSQLGVPNRRPRYYTVAGRESLGAESMPRRRLRTLRDLLQSSRPTPEDEIALRLTPEHLGKYRGAMHGVRLDDDRAVTQCFTSAYGRSHVRSGSFVITGPDAHELADGRRFSPREILRLLGFPPLFNLPPNLPTANAFRLVGNSLSLEPVRLVLSNIPGLS